MRTQIRLGLLFSALVIGCGGSATQRTAGPMPADGSFTGVYHSPQYGEMNLIQNGSAVAGEYKHEMRSGKIQGEAEGDLMRFEWIEYKAMVSNRPQETRGRGYFRYVVDPANGDHLLKGEWGLDDQDTGGGQWNAYKAKNREPRLGRSQESSGGESESYDSSDDSGDDLF